MTDRLRRLRQTLPARAGRLLTFPLGEAGSADFLTAVDTGWSTQPGTANPSFDGFSVSDGRLVCAFDAGESIDPGTTTGSAGLGAPRVESNIGDVDFDVYIKLDNDPMLENAAFAGCGFIVRTASSTARLDLYVQDDVRAPYAYGKYGGTTAVNGQTNVAGPGVSLTTNQGWPDHQRLTRSGDTFTWQASFDGAYWETVASFTWAQTVTHVGVHFFQLSPATTGTTFTLDYIHLGAQNPPTIATNPKRATLLSEDFTDLSNWTDGSTGTGGSASVSGNVLTLSAGTADGSTGRISSNTDFAENQGMVFRTRQIGTAQSQLYLGAALRGQSYAGNDWAGQYAPPISYVYEGNHQNSIVRLLRVQGDAPYAADGAKWTYLYQEDVAAADLGDWTWIRLEAAGPFFRYRVWNDGDPEPTTWQATILDGVVRGSGKVGFALSHNDGDAVSGSVEITDVTVYRVS